jgi:hypothetical protein
MEIALDKESPIQGIVSKRLDSRLWRRQVRPLAQSEESRASGVQQGQGQTPLVTAIAHFVERVFNCCRHHNRRWFGECANQREKQDDDRRHCRPASRSKRTAAPKPWRGCSRSSCSAASRGSSDCFERRAIRILSACRSMMNASQSKTKDASSAIFAIVGMNWPPLTLTTSIMVDCSVAR